MEGISGRENSKGKGLEAERSLEDFKKRKEVKGGAAQ